MSHEDHHMDSRQRYIEAMAWLRDDTTPFHRALGFDLEWITENIIEPLHNGETIAFGRESGNFGGGEKGLAAAMFVEVARVVAEYLGNPKAQKLPRSAVERAVRMCRNTQQAAAALDVTQGSFRRLVYQYKIDVPWSGALTEDGQHAIGEAARNRRTRALV